MTTQKDKWQGLRDPDTGQIPEVSVCPSRFGCWHVMRRSVLVAAFPEGELAQAQGFARRIFDGTEDKRQGP